MKHDRAYRRAQVVRLKAKRKTYWAYPRIGVQGDEAMSVKNLGRIVSCPHPCSSFCCGNQRHVWGTTKLTMQERRFFCKEE